MQAVFAEILSWKGREIKTHYINYMNSHWNENESSVLQMSFTRRFLLSYVVYEYYFLLPRQARMKRNTKKLQAEKDGLAC